MLNMILQDGKLDVDLCSSSSDMISFDFSNGDPCGPHIPASLDDDQYIEYPLGDLAGFPSDLEEEEQVSFDVFYYLVFPGICFNRFLFCRCSWKQ